VHPLAVSSPAFRKFPLLEHGLRWIQPPLPVAHPLDDGSAVVLDGDIDSTCERLGADGTRYRRLITPFVEQWSRLSEEILRPIHVPQQPWLLARFGFLALMPATAAARQFFRTERARALFAGLAGHSVLPLENYGSAAFGWVLAAAAHAVGWPIPCGGSQRISDALASYFKALGGQILPNTPIRSLAELDDFDVRLCAVTPRQFLDIAGDRLPNAFRQTLRKYRYGPGVFKVDWALSRPIPWKAAECADAATVHIGGSLDEIAAAERAALDGSLSDRPFLILTQPSLFDAARAPEGKHTAWAYCHVPHGSDADMTERIESQIERFAPGFRSRIIERYPSAPADLERHNANLVGGDISGGSNELKQLFLRPTRMLYRTPLKGVYLCSASTPPGGGVHGMCGYHAACTALRDAGIRAL
jgi:phytoene dehydrogenase-like protein